MKVLKKIKNLCLSFRDCSLMLGNLPLLRCHWYTIHYNGYMSVNISIKSVGSSTLNLDRASASNNSFLLERQIHMRNQMRERLLAMQIARSRELFYWLGTFYVLAAGVMIAGFHKTKKPATVLPLLPLTFVVLYQGDLAYGSKIQRITSEAENILQFEEQLLHLPLGLPNFDSIEEGRQEQQEEESLSRAHDIFL